GYSARRTARSRVHQRCRRVMHKSILLTLAVFAASAAAAQEMRPDPRDPKAGAPRVEYRSAFEGFRTFAADQELASWRKANDEVRAAGGHAGHRPGQGPGQQTSKPQPGGQK
ncbi:MAG: hypothetical protein ACREQZ_07175, partial [Woeseiaceae bacterium]